MLTGQFSDFHPESSMKPVCKASYPVCGDRCPRFPSVPRTPTWTRQRPRIEPHFFLDSTSANRHH